MALTPPTLRSLRTYAPLWPPDPKPVEIKPISIVPPMPSPVETKPMLPLPTEWDVLLASVKGQLYDAEVSPFQIHFRAPLEDDMELRLLKYFRNDPSYEFYVRINKDWEAEYWVRDRNAEADVPVKTPPKVTMADHAFQIAWRILFIVSLPGILTKLFG